MRLAFSVAACLAIAPHFAWSQGVAAGPTQSRSGLGTGSHPTQPTQSLPAGSQNAATGPQSRPAYPSGSSTPNPGEAFVATKPVPATGVLAAPPGNLSTTAIPEGGGGKGPGSP